MQKIDREAVKTLAIAVGVREAARRLNLNENTVVQWSKRYNWFPKPIAIESPTTYALWYLNNLRQLLII